MLIQRLAGNLLIAAGALFPAMAGSLVTAGPVDGLYISGLIGAVIIFIGFLLATYRHPAQQTLPDDPKIHPFCAQVYIIVMMD